MDDFALLDQVDEDALHAPRLLNFEEKHFKRLTKHLLTIPSVRSTAFQSPLEPSPNMLKSLDVTGAIANSQQPRQPSQQKLRDDIILEFAAFDSNIIRAQLLLNSNERERERYALEKLKIQDTAHSVRENNAVLHDQLSQAQRVLEARKGYDKLAEKITSNKTLRTQQEQQSALEILRTEIAELQAESLAYKNTWAERRDQFGKIVEEGTQMLRLIRDEKEEAERKEGLDDMSGDEINSTPGRGSRSAVPTPGGGSTPLHAPAPNDRQASPHASKLRDETLNKDLVDEQGQDPKVEVFLEAPMETEGDTSSDNEGPSASRGPKEEQTNVVMMEET